MKIAYITVRTPYGPRESFIVTEALELLRQGADVTIFPVSPERKLWEESSGLLDNRCYHYNRFDPGIFKNAFICFFLKPLKSLRAIGHVLGLSNTIRTFFKNATIIPRALAAAHLLERSGIDHIHAHWASRTATLALLASKISGIPWSFTAHRWDIYENNLLYQKVRSANFVRCISQRGRDDLARITGAPSETVAKIRVIHMGVEVPESPHIARLPAGSGLKIAVPASMWPIKGHTYLIEALALIAQEGWGDFSCSFLGDGPLEQELRRKVDELNLNHLVTFCGRVTNTVLLNAYRNREFNCVVLPSVTAEGNQHEGIPVCLIEAMAYGLPVISTRTGSIPELIDRETGLLVPEKDAAALAEALRQVAAGGQTVAARVQAARERVRKDFSLSSTSRRLMELFSEHRKAG